MDWLAIYLEEDLGAAGDITSQALFGDEAGQARMVCRAPGVAAGLAWACELWSRQGVEAVPRVDDGDPVAAGQVLIDVRGPVQGILRAERIALNIAGRMMGIATTTRHLGDTLREAGSQARVAGTRKTTPGFRLFEKEAIRIGGGDPHRMGLFDAMMVKDNHIAAAGSLEAAIRRLRAAHPGKRLEVEVESEEDARTAAQAGVEWVLIDNQPPHVGAAWAKMVRTIAPGTLVEASGGIAPDSIVAYGWADRISLGALTHQATSIDVGLDWVGSGPAGGDPGGP